MYVSVGDDNQLYVRENISFWTPVYEQDLPYSSVAMLRHGTILAVGQALAGDPVQPAPP
jgi:hypothetical protein